jgi:NAD(P) transhydrogenase subunit alpha
MIIAVPQETAEGERRVALVPAAAATLKKAGHDIRVERGAGLSSGFHDSDYERVGASLYDNRAALLAEAETIVQVKAAGANPNNGMQDIGALHGGQTLIGFAEPLTAHDATRALSERGVALLAMELIPRITRAQAMDALSSQANLAGYKAVVKAADLIGQAFPMFITAAGTIQPAKVFIIGAGVAGLQAIATAKRLGASVSAIDVRPEVKEQVESLGARFVMPPVQASGEGGYAKELTDEQKAQQQQMMADTVADADVVVTTALIPGRPAPRLVTAAMVQRMRSGSVIVDLGAERGGNVEGTEAGKIIDKNGVLLVGAINTASEVAHDASSMYAGNIVKLIQHLTGKNAQQIQWNLEDPIIAGALVCKGGKIVHPQVKKSMGIE